MKPDKPWTCKVCGEPYETRAAVERALCGGRGDLETQNLCWVCARLRHSVLAEARKEAAEGPPAG